MGKLRGMGDAGEPFFNMQAPGSRREIRPSLATPAEVAYRMVEELPFDTWEAYAFVVGTAPLWLDRADILRRNRRAVMIINSHVANGLWIGHNSSVAVNNGVFIAAGGGAISLPLSERAQVWAVATGAATVVSLAQFA